MSYRTLLCSLVFGQHFSRAVNHIGWKTSQLGDFDSITSVGGALDNFAEKDDSAATLLHRHMKILNAAQPIGKFGQLVIMRREERLGARVGMDLFDGRPRNRQPIVGRRSASDFVEQDQRLWCRSVQYRSRLRHLNHERRAATREVIRRADARKDAID